MLKAVLFDMDGVIVNSEPLHRKAYYGMFEEFHINVSNRLYESFTGKSTSAICKELCEIFDLSISHEKLMLSKRKHFKTIFDNDPEFQMIDGALSLIKNYFYNNLTLILASSASMTNINRIFKKFDLDKNFFIKIQKYDFYDSALIINIDDKKLQLTDIVPGVKQSSNQWFTVCLQSGKNREVRNLFDYHGLQVSRLKRVRFGSIFLDKDLKEGQLKELTSNEVDQIIENGI